MAIPARKESALKSALFVSQLIAVPLWLLIVGIGERYDLTLWLDQVLVFRVATLDPLHPFVWGYTNPPWAALMLALFNPLPLPIAMLVQLCIYFAVIAVIVVKVGGGVRETALALTSFVAFNAALEMNVDWLALLGLLVPPRWSGPFLVIKPQVALGYVVTFTRREWVEFLAVTAIVVGFSFVIWGWWPAELHPEAFWGGNRGVTPMRWLGWPLSLSIGAVLLWRAWRRRDPVCAVLGWLFITPYLQSHSLLIHLALLSVRHWRLALLIYVCLWLAVLSLTRGALHGGSAAALW